MGKLLIFGLGYTAARFADAMRAAGHDVRATGRAGDLDFSDEHAVEAAIGDASHIMSSVPPDRQDGGDPVLGAYGAALAAAPAKWIGYLSSTGVYGDAEGAWVDERSPVGGGRRVARAECDVLWQAVSDGVRVFRLPGIYGPGRSQIDRLRQGSAHCIDLPGQVFSRIHVDDIVGGLMASLSGPSGVYNLADDLPAPHNAVIEHAAELIGATRPPLQSLDQAGLSPMARSFYAENRRVANGKAKRLLGWRMKYPTYVQGLAACLAAERENPRDR